MNPAPLPWYEELSDPVPDGYGSALPNQLVDLLRRIVEDEGVGLTVETVPLRAVISKPISADS